MKTVRLVYMNCGVWRKALVREDGLLDEHPYCWEGTIWVDAPEDQLKETLKRLNRPGE